VAHLPTVLNLSTDPDEPPRGSRLEKIFVHPHIFNEKYEKNTKKYGKYEKI
jgi:hypothetical protein